MPILRPELQAKDWQRSRYLWTRLGYTRVVKIDDGAGHVYENRAVAAVYGRSELQDDIWLEGRARVDMRWIVGGDFSTRYRFRLEASREHTVLEHTVVPYLRAEAYYDSRYNGWSQMLYETGAEVTANKNFRVEAGLAYQSTRLPSPSSVSALALVAKWYY